MKNKYLSVAALLLFAFYFTTCGNDTGGPETWTWTERAFSLEITGSEGIIQVGDSFTLDYMGIGTLTGTVREIHAAERARANGSITDSTNPSQGWFIIVPDPPDDEEEIRVYIPPLPPGQPGLPAPPPAIYIEKEIIFSGYPKPVKCLVNRDGLIVNITLPKSVGDNEAGGKQYNLGEHKTWTFNADTYTLQYHWPAPVGNVDYEEGKYSWDSETNTLFLLPERLAYSADTPNTQNPLMTRAEAEIAYRQMIADMGMDDAAISEMTGGGYTSVNAFIIAQVNQSFGMQVYSYETSGGSFTKFTRNFATTLDDTGTTIGGIPYTAAEPTPMTGGKHYLLNESFDTALVKLNAKLGHCTTCDIQDGSSLTAGDNWVILEECVIFDSYRLVRPGGNRENGWEWPRMNLK